VRTSLLNFTHRFGMLATIRHVPLQTFHRAIGASTIR
jgi:hypothetical protein